MATSYSTGYQIKLIGSGQEAGTWGSSTNENLSRIEDALGGSVAINVAVPPSGSTWTSGSRTLTWLQQDTAAAGTAGSAAVGSGRAKFVVFGDAGSDLGGAVTVEIRGNTSSNYPDRLFFVKNALSGGQSLNLDLNGTDYVLRNGRFAVLFTSATAKGTGTKIAANTVNNALAHLQISNLDFQDDTTAQITVADSQTSALAITDGTSNLAVFDSTNNQAVFAKVDINGGTIDSVTIGDSSSSGSNNVTMGASAGTAFGANTDYTTAVGSGAMSATSALLSSSNSAAFGFEAGKGATNSTGTVYVGSNAGETSAYTTNSVYVGYAAGQYHTGTLLVGTTDNVGVGAFALRGAADSGDTGDDCVAVGTYAMSSYTSNTNCVAMGSSALRSATSGSANIAIGYKSMYLSGSVPTGSSNVAIGSESLRAAVGADQNVCIGTNAGYAVVSGDANVMIGYEAGKAETGSNKLYIENSSSATPLIYGEFDNDKVQINSAHASNDALTVSSTSGSYSGTAVNVTTTRAANSSFNFFEGIANGDVEFKVDGTGSVYNDTGTYSSPADYADMFEWEDGNPEGEDRVGQTVVVASLGKIRPSREGDIPDDVFGVVTGTACVVGNTAWNHWDKKYLKDEYGRVIQRSINGKPGPVLNPEYNDTANYVPRSHRPEWSPIGMVGRIHIRNGCPVNPSWRFLSDVSDDTGEWLVR
jgi:hypothetical protein